MSMYEENTTFLGKYDLITVEWGKGDYGTWIHGAKLYSFW